MENDWAAQHLQTIRTLMERSALYRRALAPIFTLAGVLGLCGAIVAEMWLHDSAFFAAYWMALAAIALMGGFFLIRRQALRQSEPFWSPPTRRIALAMWPSFVLGLVVGLSEIHPMRGSYLDHPRELALVWTLLYGLALHAAGFFMPRGIRLFGWAIIAAGTLAFALARFDFNTYITLRPNCLMGFNFGVSHLAYGIYLYFTERKNET